MKSDKGERVNSFQRELNTALERLHIAQQTARSKIVEINRLTAALAELRVDRST